MRQELEEVGCRPLERDLERAVVDRFHADLLRLRLAFVEFLGVLDDVEDVGVFRPGLRVEDAAVGEDEVRRLDGIAVRPLRVRPKREAPELAVVAHLPFLRRARDGLRLGVVDDEAVEEVAQDGGLRDRRGLVDVEGLGIGIVAAVVDDLRRGEARQGD
jgi:hypothetical protein